MTESNFDTGRLRVIGLHYIVRHRGCVGSFHLTWGPRLLPALGDAHALWAPPIVWPRSSFISFLLLPPQGNTFLTVLETVSKLNRNFYSLIVYFLCNYRIIPEVIMHNCYICRCYTNHKILWNPPDCSIILIWKQRYSFDRHNIM